MYLSVEFLGVRFLCFILLEDILEINVLVFIEYLCKLGVVFFIFLWVF